ncbi:GDSL-type esterase/lipase family protein [Azohydromonas sp.]|uniref:GDSL-type esterase/lipase family protein n=1 Tax=Azohydromonas sp. TaxID=1872666 RepID=UPI002C15251A|nr:GDSL-type esterase/lipase family protein [Azohydromonas sp.]HMM87315.1 GDSL-type esterase/lipase family protein [Azohydromonas sp.]
MTPTMPGRRRRASALARSLPLTLALSLVLSLGLAACRPRGEVPNACRLPPGATVLAIGDSLTRGHGADGQGYAEQLQALLARDGSAHAGVEVVNLGIDGERSAGLRARIDDALAAHRPAVVLITSGGNDFLRRVAADETRAHLRAVVDRVRAAGATPMLFAVPAPTLGAAVGLADAHPLYAELADDTGVHVIDGVVADVLSRDALRSDRIHPNAAGYARMAQAAFDALQRCR